MKRFKIGFLALVALLAMSFTIVSREGSTKNNATSLRVADCYTKVTVYAGTPLPACMTPLAVELNINSNSCTEAQAQALKIAGSFAGPVIDAADCPPTGSVFCCAKKENVTCSNVTKERIKEIVCKPTE